VTVADLVGHIQCELYHAPGFTDLATNRYQALVTLTLKVDDNFGVSPTLSFIGPLDPGTSLTTSVGGTLSVARQRIFTTAYTIDLNTLLKNAPKVVGLPNCTSAKGTGGFTLNLTGDLGLGGIIAAGQDATYYKDVNATIPSSPNQTLDVIFDPNKAPTMPPNAQVIPDDKCHAKKDGPNSKPCDQPPTTTKVANHTPPNFGSTIQFTIIKAINAGPLWSLIHFKGPSSANGLVNVGRTDTDTLVIAFAPGAPILKPGISTLSKEEQQQQDAADATAAPFVQNQLQTLTNNMILQNLQLQ